MKNKLIIFYSTAIILISFGLLYITYGYMATKITGNSNTSVSITSRYLAIEYSDGTENLSDESSEYFIPGSTITKTFSIKNTGNVDLDYNILIENLSNPFIRTQDITYDLYLNEELIISDIFPTNDSPYLYRNAKILKNETQNYKLVITYLKSRENQIEDQGKIISGKIGFEENKEPLNKLNIYGNTLLTLAEGTTQVSPTAPGSLTSLGTLVTDRTDSNYGKYKIDLIAQYKNKLDMNKWYDDWYNKNSTKIEKTTFNDEDCYLVTMSSYYNYEWAPIEFKENTQYTLSADFIQGTGKVTFRFYYTDGTRSDMKNISSTTDWERLSLTSTAGKTIASIRGSGAGTGNVYVKNIQLEEGTTGTKYESYIDSNDEATTKSIYLNAPLRCVDSSNNDYCDHIDLLNKKVVRNVHEYEITGNEQIQRQEFPISSGLYRYYISGKVAPLAKQLKALSTHFKYNSSVIGTNNVDQVFGIYKATPIFLWRYDEYTSVEAMTEWLKQNHVKIQYILGETDETEKVSIPNIDLSGNKIITATDGALNSTKTERE